MGVFEMGNAKKMCVFGVAPQMRIPLPQVCHQQCFWIPSMGVFEVHNAKKNVRLWCGAPNAHTPARNIPVFVYLLFC